jgi:predicted DNA-binding transcriptional regulator AlpA
MSIAKEIRLLRRSEVEDLFGISVRFLELAAMRGDGPPIVRLGRSVRYRVCDIHDWIEKQIDRGSGD